MRVEPIIRNNICITAHPTGCAEQVKEQIQVVANRPAVEGPKRVLVVGASNGYGLAARIVAAFSSQADTLGVFLERMPTERKLGTAGWYNTVAFEREARRAGRGAWSINGDAFTVETKNQAIGLLQDKMGPVDLIVYSIAAPRRIDPRTKKIYSTSIKPIGRTFHGKTVDIQSGKIVDVTAEPATEKEIAHTIKVMGGEDWRLWLEALAGAKLLARGATTIALSYIGPEITAPLYREGTIGAAKRDLERTASELSRAFASSRLRALVSVNKALVTRASAVIPSVTMYISLLYRVMQSKELHEGCIHQMSRLFSEFLYSTTPRPLDHKGRIRLDDWEMREDVQEEVRSLWCEVVEGGATDLPEISDFREELLRYHGFRIPGVDYEAEVTSVV